MRSVLRRLHQAIKERHEASMKLVTRILIAALVLAAGWWLWTHVSRRTVETANDVTPQTDFDGNPYPSDKPTPPAPAAPAATPIAVLPATTPTPAATPVPVTAAKAPASLPGGDTLDRNAPAGMAFGGKGRFQWYRQGNLTWRIDTTSGTTCVDFATMDEWQKPIVYSNGCRYRS